MARDSGLRPSLSARGVRALLAVLVTALVTLVAASVLLRGASTTLSDTGFLALAGLLGAGLGLPFLLETRSDDGDWWY
jgi:hypothetical protein